MFNNVPVHYGGLREIYSSDSQTPFPSPNAVNQRLIKVLVSLDSGENWASVDLGDARSGQMVKERLFSKFNIPSNYWSLYSVYQHQGDAPSGPPLSDELIAGVCQMYGDFAATLRFSVKGPALQSTPISTPPLSGLQQSLNPQNLIHVQSLYQMETQTPTDIGIPPRNTSGTSMDYLSPPLPNLMRPVLSIHPRPLTSGLNSNWNNGYTTPLDPAFDGQWQQTLATMEPKTQIDFPNMRSLGSASLRPSILSPFSPPPSATAATGRVPVLGLEDEDGNDLLRDKGMLLAFQGRTGMPIWSRGRTMAPPLQPRYLPHPPPTWPSPLTEMNQHKNVSQMQCSLKPYGDQGGPCEESIDMLGPSNGESHLMDWCSPRPLISEYSFDDANTYSLLPGTPPWAGEILPSNDHGALVSRSTDSSFHTLFPGSHLSPDPHEAVIPERTDLSSHTSLPSSRLPLDPHVGSSQRDAIFHTFLESGTMDITRPSFPSNSTRRSSLGIDTDFMQPPASNGPPRFAIPDTQIVPGDGISMIGMAQARGVFTHAVQDLNIGFTAASCNSYVYAQDDFGSLYSVNASDANHSASPSALPREQPTYLKFQDSLLSCDLAETRTSHHFTNLLDGIHPQLPLTSTGTIPVNLWGLPPSSSDRVLSENITNASKTVNPKTEVVLRVFLPLSSFPNEALARVLDLIKGSPFFLLNQKEPSIDSEEGRHLMRIISQIPDCPPFPDLQRDHSIYVLLIDIPTNKCLICGLAKTSLKRAITCVRTHLDHRPFVCGEDIGACPACSENTSPARFCSSSLLNDHINGPTKKYKCFHPGCGRSFRRGGMRKHWKSMHKHTLFPYHIYTSYRRPKSPKAPSTLSV